MPGKTHRIGPSLIDTAKAFANEKACHEYLEAARWPKGVHCLKCDHGTVSKFTTKGKIRTGKDGQVKQGPDRYMYQCLKCKYQFQTTTETIFSDTHLPLSKWLLAVAIMCNAKKGVSAKQMERDMGISYKTSWYLNHRIRKAMEETGGQLFKGTVEADETYVGGKYDRRRKRAKYDKEPVFGVKDRESGKVQVRHIPEANRYHIHNVIDSTVAKGAQFMTDESPFYKSLARKGFGHEIVCHSDKEWVRGDCHTQGIDSFWGLLKRGIIGSFHQVSIKHLHRYCGEFQFRFNSRQNRAVFAAVVTGLVIKGALRYKALTASEIQPSPSDEPMGDLPF